MAKFWKSVLPLLLGLALLLWLWSRFSLEQVRQAFQHVGWGMIPLVGLACLWLPWDTLTLSRLLPPGALRLRLMALEWSCDSLSTLIPLGGLGGEPFRFRHLPAYTARPLPVVVSYRTMHAWAGLFTAWAGAGLCWATGQPGLPWGKLALAGCLVWSCGAVAFVRAQRRFFSELPLARVASAFAAKLVSRSLQVAEVGCVLLALGVPLTPGGLLLIHSSLMAAASMFAFIPGGLGVHETALLGACQQLGMSPEVGFQLGLIRRVRQLGWSLLGLLAVLYLERTRKTT